MNFSCTFFYLPKIITIALQFSDHSISSFSLNFICLILFSMIKSSKSISELKIKFSLVLTTCRRYYIILSTDSTTLFILVWSSSLLARYRYQTLHLYDQYTYEVNAQLVLYKIYCSMNYYSYYCCCLNCYVSDESPLHF